MEDTHPTILLPVANDVIIFSIVYFETVITRSLITATPREASACENTISAVLDQIDLTTTTPREIGTSEKTISAVLDC